MRPEIRDVVAQLRQQHKRVVPAHVVGDGHLVKAILVVVDMAHIELVVNVVGESRQQITLLANDQVTRLQLYERHADD
ncbi:unnamed protein product [Sphagnum tenellum]